MKFRKMSVPFAYPSGIIGIFDRRWNERQIILFPGLLFLSYFNDTFLYIGTAYRTLGENNINDKTTRNISVLNKRKIAHTVFITRYVPVYNHPHV